MIAASVKELVSQLYRNPSVLGVIIYGSAADAPFEESSGDIDLCLVVQRRPAGLESLHFFAGTRPVDLNIRTMDELRSGTLQTPIDQAILEGKVLFARDQRITAELGLARLQRRELADSPNSAQRASIRFGHSHTLHKVSRRLESHPILCRLLLQSNLYWLIQNYFLVRQLPYSGEKRALEYVERNDPAVWQLILSFYAHDDLKAQLQVSEALGELVLGPIGGLWKPGEVLAFPAPGAEEDDVQEAGQEFLTLLLGGAGT